MVVLVACLLAVVAVWLSTWRGITALCFLAATFGVASLVELRQVDPSLRVWIGLQLGMDLLVTVGLGRARTQQWRDSSAKSRSHA